MVISRSYRSRNNNIFSTLPIFCTLISQQHGCIFLVHRIPSRPGKSHIKWNPTHRHLQNDSALRTQNSCADDRRPRRNSGNWSMINFIRRSIFLLPKSYLHGQYRVVNIMLPRKDLSVHSQRTQDLGYKSLEY